MLVKELSMRILLIDEDPEQRKRLRRALTGYAADWHVDEAESGDKAIGLIAEGERYDLVFLADDLRGRTWTDVMGDIRLEDVPPPVVLITGGGENDVAAAFRHAAYDYVVKAEDGLKRLPDVSRRLAEERARAREELARSEEQNRSLFEHSMDGILLTIPDGTILAANPEACRIYGRTEEDLRRVGRAGVMDAAEPRLAAALDERTRTGRFRGRLTQLRSDGTTFPAEISSSVFRDKDGLKRTWMIVRDVSDQVRAEEMLLHSRNLLQTVLDSISAAVFWKDRNLNYLGGNRAWLEAAGLKSARDAIGKSDYDLPWTREQADSFRKHDRRVMETGRPEYDTVEPFLRADGTTAWARTTKVPLRDAVGDVVGVMGTYEDITERKRAEQKVRESEEKYRSLASAADSMYLVDRDCRYTFANEEYLSRLGLDSAEVIGRSYGEFHSKDDANRFAANVARVLQSGQSLQSEHKSRRDRKTFLRTFSPVLDSQGGAVAVTVISKDITELKHMEDALTLSVGELRQLSKRLMDLQESERARISRELHDEMGATLTMLRINIASIKKSLPPESPAGIKAMLADAYALTKKMIDQIHQLTLDLRPQMLDDLGLVSTLRWYAEEFGQKTKIQVRISQKGWARRLDSETASVLFRIIQEALTNAAKHSRAKKVVIRLAQKTKGVEALVEDDGVGFDPREVERRPLKKRGIGFVSMKERSSLVGGELGIDSRPGGGTRIQARIPWRKHDEKN